MFHSMPVGKTPIESAVSILLVVAILHKLLKVFKDLDQRQLALRLDVKTFWDSRGEEF